LFGPTVSRGIKYCISSYSRYIYVIINRESEYSMSKSKMPTAQERIFVSVRVENFQQANIRKSIVTKVWTS